MKLPMVNCSPNNSRLVVYRQIYFVRACIKADRFNLETSALFKS